MATTDTQGESKAPTVKVEGEAPVREISKAVLTELGNKYYTLFEKYAADRKLVEQKWIRNLRQYMGIYDPEVERMLPANASRAYPRITRVKCISLLSRVMNLMFPGNERNWEIKASPSADMDPEEVAGAVQALMQKRQEQGLETPPTEEILDAAVQDLADKRAEELSRLIDDQLQELGGDQTDDYILLNRAVLKSGIRYGVGVLQGPFIREVPKTVWRFNNGNPEPSEVTLYKPQYEFIPVWDFYPDMADRRPPGEGYFLRKIMSKSGLRELANREDFFSDQIKNVIKQNPQGNYKEKSFESELRSMTTTAHVNVDNREHNDRYEIVVWYGSIPADKLEQVGAEVPDDKKADSIEAELWLVGRHVIKADINPWRKLGMKVKTVHTFVFDENDTSPLGDSLPDVMRDSQMSVSAAARMSLDNASITCGPNLEVNVDLLRLDQDITQIEPYKIWYREGLDASAQYPAVRNIQIEGHLPELQSMMSLFMQFADQETFIGPATGGDMERMPSEPMRTAAGASMVRGDAALPFKDIVRNFDSFTQSVILSLVAFNKKYNPAIAPEGDYNVIARGATSLVAKEVRAMQMDALAQTLTDEERDHIDARKLARARLAARDMGDMLVSDSQAQINRDQRMAATQEQQEQIRQMAAAQLREILSDAYKNMTQGQKNVANASATQATTALDIMTRSIEVDNEEA